MSFDVSSQRALHSKGPETLWTLEGLLVGVDADVAHKVTGLPELLCAVGTHVPPYPVLLTNGACSDKAKGKVQTRSYSVPSVQERPAETAHCVSGKL